MPRAKGGYKRRRRHKKVLAMAKGFTGGRNRQFRQAKDTARKKLARRGVGGSLFNLSEETVLPLLQPRVKFILFSYYSGMVLGAPQVAAQAYFDENKPHLGRLHMENHRNFGLFRHRWWFLFK